MKKFLTSLSCALFILFSIIFTACAKDPYKGYVAPALEPMTKLCTDEGNEYYEIWRNNANKVLVFYEYLDYKNFGVDLGYTKGFFERNNLMLVLKTTNSSSNDKFIEVLVENGQLRPVIECNDIKPEDNVTADIILYAFYSEFKKQDNYTAGEIIIRTR